MQTLSYLHSANKACSGYDKYLKNRNEGRWIMFNPYFLFFQGFYLIYHKMYKETFLYSLLFGYYLSLGIKLSQPNGINEGFVIHYDNVFLSFFLIVTTALLSNFFFYKIYELHNNEAMYKFNYDPKKFITATEPYSNMISLIVLILGHIFMVWTLLLSFMVFSSFK